MPLPTAPALAVYSYDDTGKLTFENSVPTVGAFLPCWIAITKDGRWLYTTSAATNNVTVFDITDPTKPKQIRASASWTRATPGTSRLDPTDKFLVVNGPRAAPVVPPGKGNFQHVLSVGADGKLTDLAPGMGKVTSCRSRSTRPRTGSRRRARRLTRAPGTPARPRRGRPR